ncbi:MAG: XrtA/PEP-CTERM system TPR-repeat protein PrsT, partial [Acetobacteraceae bacterium]
MRKSLGCAMLVGLSLGFVGPVAARAANYVGRAQGLMAKGETRAAAIELRNAVKHDPGDGAAHYELAKLDLMLGNAVAAEREARAAQQHGYAPGKSLSLLLDTYLAQARYKDLLRDFPAGKGTPDAQARIAVGRGQAELALGQLDRAKADFATASRLAPHAIYTVLAGEDLDVQQHRLSAARAAIAAALAIDPHSQRALLRKATLLLASGDAKGAVGVLEPVRANAPGDPQVRLALANALIGAGEDAKAAGEVKAALAIVPGSAEGMYLQALLAAKAGQYDKANALLQKLSPVIARLPQAYLLQGVTKEHLGQWAEARDALQHFLGRFPGDPRGERLLAEVELHAHKPKQALAELARLPATEQEDPATLGLLGRAHAAAGDYASAKREFTAAAKLDPHLAEPHAELAAVDLRLGDLRAAISEYRKALSIAPDDAAVRRSLVAAEIESGQYKQAASNLDALRKQKGTETANELLRAQLELAELDVSDAHDTYAKVLKAHPDSVVAALGIARAAILQGNRAEADRRLKSILAKDPANRSALGLLTAMLAGEGKAPEAYAAVERAHGAAPRDAAITADLAALDIRKKQADKALDLLAASSSADQPVMLSLKAQAEIALGKRSAAEDTLRMLLAHAPNDASARLALARLLTQGKDFAGARAALQDGLSQSPRNLELMQALIGVASAEHGAAAGLAEAKALASDPSHQPEAGAMEGDTYMAQHKPEMAAAAYADAFKKSPSDALVLRLGSALQASGKSAEATGKLRSYIKQHPDDIPVALVLASSEIQKGQLDAAAERLQRIIAVQPNNAVALNDLAWIRGEEGRPEALQLAERAYFLSGNAHIADTLGWILSRAKPSRTGV